MLAMYSMCLSLTPATPTPIKDTHSWQPGARNIRLELPDLAFCPSSCLWPGEPHVGRGCPAVGAPFPQEQGSG